MMEQGAKDAIVVAIRFLLLLFIGVASWTLMSLWQQFDDGNEEALPLSYQSLNDLGPTNQYHIDDVEYLAPTASRRLLVADNSTTTEIVKLLCQQRGLPIYLSIVLLEIWKEYPTFTQA